MVISIELSHRRIHHTNEGSKTLSNFSSWSKVFSSYLRSECMIVAGLWRCRKECAQPGRPFTASHVLGR